MRTISRGRFVVIQVVAPIVLIALWWVTSVAADSFFWPPLPDIIESFVDTWIGPAFFSDVIPSVTRLLVGYSLAVMVGVAMGVLLGSVVVLRNILEPVLEFFRAIPVPVLIPVMMLFLGIDDDMKVLIIMIGSIWPILLNTIEGVRGIDEVLRETSQSYRIRPVRRLTTLVLPGASPQIMAGAKLAMSLAIIVMVISEMFAASNGLGFKILQFQQRFSIPDMWGGIVVLGLLGISLAGIFRLVESTIMKWHEDLRRMERG